nr:predicted protein [Mycena chlorophos]
MWGRISHPRSQHVAPTPHLASPHHAFEPLGLNAIGDDVLLLPTTYRRLHAHTPTAGRTRTHDQTSLAPRIVAWRIAANLSPRRPSVGLEVHVDGSTRKTARRWMIIRGKLQ